MQSGASAKLDDGPCDQNPAGQAAARKAKVDAGLRFSKLNLGPATFLETLTESYYEVVSPPYGEGLVGKKFPWAYTVMCRSDGGEEW